MNSNGTAVQGASARFKQLPRILRDLDRWVIWDEVTVPGGRATKKPMGSTLDPTNRLGMAHALRVSGRRHTDAAAVGGVGINLTGGVDVPIAPDEVARLLAFDMDGCRCPRTGALVAWASTMVDYFGRSYTEITPSGCGLRLWLLVRNPPRGVPVIDVPHPAPEGVTKNPEIQVFGCGPAGYVTVTGDRLPGAGDIEVVHDLDTWLKQWKVEEADLETAVALLEDLLPSEGDGPTPEEIAAKVDPDLAAGRYEAVGVPSASECWWRLVRETMRAAGHHGPAAVAYLLGHTAYGAGLVDSRDPDRYTKRDWVIRDVARIVGKARERSAAEVFADDLDPNWQPPPGTEAPKRVLGDVLQAGVYCANQGEIEWIVWNVIPGGAKLGQLFGDPSAGKTPVALHLALSIALGLPEWFGHDIDMRGVAVGYLVGEDAIGMAGRVRAQLAELDPLADIDDVPLFLTTRPAQLMDPKNARAWAAKIKAATGGKRLGLLVVDTQNRNFGDGNENATEDMTAFVRSIDDELARALGCCVLLVHHTGHMNKQRSRGASVLPAALDVAFEVRKTGRAVTIHNTKAKHAREAEDMVGRLVPVQIGRDKKGRPITSITLHDQPPSAADLFADEETEPMDEEITTLLDVVADSDGQPQTQQALMEATGMTRKQLRLRVQRARELGFLRVVEGSGRTPASYFLTSAGRASKDSVAPESDGPDGLEELLS